MGCLSFILALVILFVIVKIFQVFLIFLPVIAVICLIASYVDYKDKKELLPTKMECPNCGSNDIKIHSIQTGETSSSNISGNGNSVTYDILGLRTSSSINGRKNSRKEYEFKREGICQECGFNFNYYTWDDIHNVKVNSKIKFILSSIFLVISIILCVLSYSNLSGFEKTNETTNGNIWASKYTSIEDFDYYLDGNNVYLKEYIGNSKKIRIDNSYNINGKIYNVVSFADGVFTFKNVYSVILPEGLTTMPANTFNSSDIKYVYIPESLKSDNSKYPFYKYFHDVEKIYYGGTEEQWKKLTNNANRSEIDVKEIVYNINIINEL